MNYVKWMFILAGGVVLVIAALVTFDDMAPIDLRANVSRSAVVAYCCVREDGGRREMVVKELWKQPAERGEIAVGKVLPTPLPRDGMPEGCVVFLEPGSLRANAMIAVHNNRLAEPDISLADARAICAGK